VEEDPSLPGREEEDPISKLGEAVSELRERVARLEADVDWVKKILHKVDIRTWAILAGVVVGILVALLK